MSPSRPCRRRLFRTRRSPEGTALVTIDKLYSQRNSREPRTEHWLLSVTYYLNPKQVSDQARVFPQFETINPLGLTITEFHENRMSVDPMPVGVERCLTSGGDIASRGGNAMSYHLILPFFPEELRELLLDPSISDLMINGTTGRVCGSSWGRAAHSAVRAVHQRPTTGGD